MFDGLMYLFMLWSCDVALLNLSSSICIEEDLNSLRFDINALPSCVMLCQTWDRTPRNQLR